MRLLFPASPVLYADSIRGLLPWPEVTARRDEAALLAKTTTSQDAYTSLLAGTDALQAEVPNFPPEIVARVLVYGVRGEGLLTAAGGSFPADLPARCVAMDYSSAPTIATQAARLFPAGWIKAGSRTSVTMAVSIVEDLTFGMSGSPAAAVKVNGSVLPVTPRQEEVVFVELTRSCFQHSLLPKPHRLFMVFRAGASPVFNPPDRSALLDPNASAAEFGITAASQWRNRWASAAGGVAGVASLFVATLTRNAPMALQAARIGSPQFSRRCMVRRTIRLFCAAS